MIARLVQALGQKSHETVPQAGKLDQKMLQYRGSDSPCNTGREWIPFPQNPCVSRVWSIYTFPSRRFSPPSGARTHSQSKAGWRRDLRGLALSWSPHLPLIARLPDVAGHPTKGDLCTRVTLQVNCRLHAREGRKRSLPGRHQWHFMSLSKLQTAKRVGHTRQRSSWQNGL